MILTDGNDNLDTGCLFSCCRQRSPDFVISGREGRSIHIKRQAIYIKGSGFEGALASQTRGSNRIGTVAYATQDLTQVGVVT